MRNYRLIYRLIGIQGLLWMGQQLIWQMNCWWGMAVGLSLLGFNLLFLAGFILHTSTSSNIKALINS